MEIKSLSISNFRNYKSADIEFGNNINMIIGKNGQGKTNLIEGIYMLSLGRSFRTNKDKEMVMFDTQNSYISSLVTSRDREYKIEIKMGKDVKKAIKINSIPIEKLSDLLGIINIVIFSPEDLKLVREGPKERRSFMDRELSQIRPSYYQILYTYQKTLLQRNNLLKKDKVDKGLLDVYDLQLASSGWKIMQYRKEFIEKIGKVANRNHSRISGGKENLSVIYSPNAKVLDKSSSDLEIMMRNSRDEDLSRRTTTIGPHKDDLSIFINDMELRSFGSQGQKRSAAISLKLSEIELIYEEKGEYPVVLLDDIFSELDINRQRMLLENLDGIQTFVTTTEIIDIERESKIYKIENAVINTIKWAVYLWVEVKNGR